MLCIYKSMRTSTSQFETMISFMEQNGCLKVNKSLSRLQVLQKWDELTILLNNDTSGESKPVEKWRKVWSDLKNNTKKKAFKLRASISNGRRGPVLSDLEARVLTLLSKYGKLEKVISIAEYSTYSQDSDRSIRPQSPQDGQEYTPMANPDFVALPDIKPSFLVTQASPLAICTHDEWEEPTLEQSNNASPSPVSESSESVIPDIEGQIPKPRNHIKLPTKQSRKRRADTSTERLMKYIIHKGRAEVELEKERLRLREIELDIQRKWQEVAVKAIDTLNKVIDKKLEANVET